MVWFAQIILYFGIITETVNDISEYINQSNMCEKLKDNQSYLIELHAAKMFTWIA